MSNKLVGVRVGVETWRRLKVACAERGVTVQAAVTEAVEAWVGERLVTYAEVKRSADRLWSSAGPAKELTYDRED